MAIGNLVIPTGLSPATPATWEMLQDLYEQLATGENASGSTTHGTAISDATTNQALITIPSTDVAALVAANVVYMSAWGIYSTPSTGAASLEWAVYSGGSSGTALASVTISSPTASMTNAPWAAEAWVNVYSATAVQCVLKLWVGTSNSSGACTPYVTCGTTAAGTSITANQALSINAVMGSSVVGSSFEGLGGFWNQAA